MKILKQNNTKGVLSSVEKKRFQQIGDQFFKGSYEFFVQYQQSIHKTVDVSIINSNFVQHLQSQIKEAKEKLIDKSEILKIEKEKEKFQNRLLNFIIALEAGVIAILKLPFDFEKIKQFALSSFDMFVDGVKLLKNSYGDLIDFSSWVTKKFADVLNLAGGFILDGFSIIANGFNFLLNYSEAFETCFDKLAEKIAKRGTGLIGLLMRVFMWFIKDEAYKRPNLSHWLMYGVKEYETVKKIEDEVFDTIVSSNNDLSIFNLSFRDALHGFFGYENYRDKFWGALVGNSNASIGKWIPVDESNSSYKWIGVDEGKALYGTNELELTDVKKALNTLQTYVQDAAKSSSKKYSVETIYGRANLLKDDIYIKKIPEEIKKLMGKEVDMGSYKDEKFLNLMINPNGDNTFAAQLGELQKAESEIFHFYSQYKNSADPFAKSICLEIEDKLFDKNEWGEKYEVRITNMGIRMKSFIFIPPIRYAIVQYEYIISRNEKLIATLNRKVAKMANDMDYYTNEDFKDYKELETRFLNGNIDFAEFIKEVVSTLKTSEFKMIKIIPEVELTFVEIAKRCAKIFENGISEIQDLIQTGNKKYISSQYVHITRDSLKTFDEISIKTTEAQIQKITDGNKKIKESLKEKYSQRAQLLSAIRAKIAQLKEKNVICRSKEIVEQQYKETKGKERQKFVNQGLQYTMMNN